MNTATKRTIIATAALAAAGLFGSLPYDAASVAQQGVPTVHRDVALVDVTDTTLIGDEGIYDSALSHDVAGAESTLFTDLTTSLGATDGHELLDATTPAGDFNGAETQGFDALLVNDLVTQDHVNQLVGVSETVSQTAILADFTADGGTIPAGADVTLAELTAAVGTSTFDTDLSSIATADFSSAATDFQGYLTSLSGDTLSLTDFSTLFTDVSSSFSDLSNLSADFSTVVTDVTALLGGAL